MADKQKEERKGRPNGAINICIESRTPMTTGEIIEVMARAMLAVGLTVANEAVHAFDGALNEVLCHRVRSAHAGSKLSQLGKEVSSFSWGSGVNRSCGNDAVRHGDGLAVEGQVKQRCWAGWIGIDLSEKATGGDLHVKNFLADEDKNKSHATTSGPRWRDWSACVARLANTRTRTVRAAVGASFQ